MIQIINLPKILDQRGNLSFVEELKHIPFEIKRSYWIYDVPGGAERGGHAYRKNDEFMIALSGSFDVVLNDGKEEKIYHLNRSYYGLYVPRMIWRSMRNFSTNSFVSRRIEKMKKTTVYDCSMVEMDKHHHETGNITVIENGKTIPFDVKRVYYLYDIPGGESRGAHAHKELKQLIIAASGSFEVTLDDGNVKRTFTLNRPYQGLLVVPGIWRELNNFSSGAVCLVMASLPYDEKDYIREYDHFINYKKYE